MPSCVSRRKRIASSAKAKHEGHQPHVGIGRAEDDPRQQDEGSAQHQRGEGQHARQGQPRVDDGEQEHDQADEEADPVPHPPAVAKHGVHREHLVLPVEPVGGLPPRLRATAASAAAAGEAQALPDGAQDRAPPASPIVMARTTSAEKASRPRKPQPKAWHSQTRMLIGTNKAARSRSGACGRAAATGEGEHRQRDAQRIIDEAEQEMVAVDERQREHHRRRQPVMHLARDPQHAGRGHHRDGDDDQLHRRFEPDQPGQRIDRRSTPRLPISAHLKLYTARGSARRRRASPGSGPCGRAGRPAAAPAGRAGAPPTAAPSPPRRRASPTRDAAFRAVLGGAAGGIMAWASPLAACASPVTPGSAIRRYLRSTTGRMEAI
jgi:hypothetical protein